MHSQHTTPARVRNTSVRATSCSLLAPQQRLVADVRGAAAQLL